jgi:hypothetical protein
VQLSVLLLVLFPIFRLRIEGPKAAEGSLSAHSSQQFVPVLSHNSPVAISLLISLYSFKYYHSIYV